MNSSYPWGSPPPSGSQSRSPFGRAMNPSRLVPTKTDAVIADSIPQRSIEDGGGLDFDQEPWISERRHPDPCRRRRRLAREEVPESAPHRLGFLGSVVHDLDPQ